MTMPLVPAAVSARRLKHCEACEHCCKPVMKCEKCGCFMLIKAKLAMAKCPVGRW